MSIAAKSKSKRQSKNSQRIRKTESKQFSWLDHPEIKIARELGEDDFQFFCQYFLEDYFTLPPCQMHREMFHEYSDAVASPERWRIVKAAPRENAKSTITSEALPLWCICYSKKKLIIIAADATGQAKRHVEAIRGELEDNDRIAEAFPEVAGEGPKWTDEEIRTRNGCTVIATGTGKRIRGLKQRANRPDLLIGDDLENDENVQTIEQRNKSQDWFDKAFAKAGKAADIFVVGTVLHYDSLLARLLNNPSFRGRKYRSVIRWSEAASLWTEWERIFTDWSLSDDDRKRLADEYYRHNEDAMCEGTEVLWPEFESYYELIQQRVAEGPASFDSEKQNEPINPADCLFQDEWFQYWDESERGTHGLSIVAACDPSLGGKSKHDDPSAIISIGRDSAGILYVCDADIEKRPPDKIIKDCIALHEERKLCALGVESVQFQDFFRDVMIKEAALQGKYPPIHKIVQTKDKRMRIQRIQPLVKSGRLRFQRKHKTLMDQLRYYPKADHDDGPDALEMAVQMVELVGQSYGGSNGNGRTARRRDNLNKVFG